MSERSSRRRRIRRTRDMRHVRLVDTLPADGRYVPLRVVLAACPGARRAHVAFKNAIHFLLERGELQVVARQGPERARRLYDREQIPFIRAVLEMHRNGLLLDKAVELARKRKRPEQARLF